VGADSSGAAAAAAQEREVAALKHNLLQKLPRALTAAAADEAAVATASAGAAVPSVGVQLLLWPSGSSGSEGYSRVFADVSSRWGSSSSELAPVGFGFAAWQSFTQR
jgi:hypothetical protein